MPYQRVLQLYYGLKVELTEITDEIEQANKTAPSHTRPRVCNSFNPRFLDISTSV